MSKVQITETEFKLFLSRQALIGSIDQALSGLNEPMVKGKGRPAKVVTGIDFNYKGCTVEFEKSFTSARRAIDPLIIEAYKEFLQNLKSKLLSSSSVEVIPDLPTNDGYIPEAGDDVESKKKPR